MNSDHPAATERERAWSSCAGEVSAFKTAIGILKTRAAEMFIGDKNEVANALKETAKQIEATHLAPLQAKLMEFIKGDFPDAG